MKLNIEIIYGLLFFIILGVNLAALLSNKIIKTKLNTLFPLISLPLYIWYEYYFLRPEVLITVPIRVDLFILHPMIIAAFIVSIIRKWKEIKADRKRSQIFLLTLVVGFAYWWYYILIVCKFYITS